MYQAQADYVVTPIYKQIDSVKKRVERDDKMR